MAATLSQLLFNVADKQVAEPVLFLPLADRGHAVPVKVAEVAIEEGKLTLLVEPLTAPQRADLLARIRSPQPNGAAQAAGN